MRIPGYTCSRRELVMAIAGGTLARARSAGEESHAVAIVARPDLPVDNLSFAELRRVMLGDRQYWTRNLKVTLLVRAPGAHEREVVLKTIYQMSEAQFRQYWIAKVFRAEATSAPRIVYSNEMATELVAQIPGAVAFVDAAQVPKDLKILKIDGRLPGQPGYPLH
jgi:ABC-type phosphate transport system substrate-binding protein